MAIIPFPVLARYFTKSEEDKMQRRSNNQIYIHKAAFRPIVWLSVYNFYFDKSNNQKIEKFDYLND